MSHVASKRNLFYLYFSTNSDKALVLRRAVLSIFLGYDMFVSMDLLTQTRVA